MPTFPHYIQPDAKDCGPTCLKIIAKHYGRTLALQYLRSLTETTREGSSLLGLSEAAEQVGFRTLGVKIAAEQLAETPLPCVLHWGGNHFVVLYKVISNSLKGGVYYLSDPAHGLLKYNEQEFLERWIGKGATKNYNTPQK